jgi:integrase/recombinase XerC
MNVEFLRVLTMFFRDRHPNSSYYRSRNELDEFSGAVMSQGKQAKVLRPRELQRLLDHVSHSRHPARDRVMVLLSFKAGLRAKEIAGLTWSMVTTATGDLADAISLPNRASKGKGGGRTIPLHNDLRAALVSLKAVRGDKLRPHLPVVYSERADGYSPNAVAVWFLTRYRETGVEGASSHSGRRTFITAAAKKISEAGGSLRDIQELAGHSSLGTTQRYIQGDSAAKRNVIALI